MKKSELRQIIKEEISKIFEGHMTSTDIENLNKNRGYIKDFTGKYYPIINVYLERRKVVVEYGKYSQDFSFSSLTPTSEIYQNKPVWKLDT